MRCRQKEWDDYAVRLHAGSTWTWDECLAETFRRLGGRPKACTCEPRKGDG